MRRVLLVEDDDVVRGQLMVALTEERYLVTGVDNAQAAVQHLEGDGEPPELIVLDLLMPLMSGFELLAWLAKRGVLSEVPVLLISGTGHSADARALHPTIAGSLRKPFDREEFLQEVGRIFDRSGP